MVYHASRLDATFSALSDPTRRAILARLRSGEHSISDLAARFEMTLPGVSKHIRVLESAGLATIRKEGRVRRARFNPQAMRGAHDWIEHYRQYWESELDQLAAYFENPSPTKEQKWPARQPTPQQLRASRSAAPSGRRGSRSSTRGRNRKS